MYYLRPKNRPHVRHDGKYVLLDATLWVFPVWIVYMLFYYICQLVTQV